MALERKEREEAHVYYPESDGKPMAETDYHLEQMIENIASLRYHYRKRPDVYVSGNLFVYYEKGNLKKCFSPDLMVVFGSAKHKRRVWLIWEEKAPDFVMEVTSSSTAKTDTELKHKLYTKLGVKEYVLFDPLGDYLGGNRLRFFRLEGGNYVEVLPLKNHEYESRVLGLKLRVEGERVRFIDPQTGMPLPTREELKASLLQAEKKRLEEALARWEAEKARWEAEKRRQEEARARREAEKHRLEEAQARWEAERQRLEAEKQRQEEALARREAEKRRLEEALARREAEKQRQEEALARREAEKQRQEEALARREAEKRRLEAENARLNAEKHAKEEARRRAAAEEELARLKALLKSQNS